jgi:tetratricopeptide (TPR) repeat protein
MNFAEFFGSYHSPGRDAFDKGESLIKKSGYKLAIDSFKNASTLLKAEGKVAGQGFCYSRMGECYVVQDKVDEAIECFELALPLLESEVKSSSVFLLCFWFFEL